jgi:Ca-activated chloride channel family protein
MSRTLRFAVAALVIWLANAAEASDRGTLTGKVLNNGRPVVGAQVTARGPMTKKVRTDAGGDFELTGLLAGHYRVTVSRSGLKASSTEVDLLAGKTIHRRIHMITASRVKVDKKRKSGGGRSVASSPAPMVAPMGSMGMSRGRRRPMVAMPAESMSANTEDYVHHGVRDWVTTKKDKLSTFAVDVDTASYAIARRKILGGIIPPASSVRVEEFVNYFRYDYPEPSKGPFAVHLEAAPSPFNDEAHIVRVGVKAKEANGQNRKPMHLTFLVDTSGSMSSADKLPLVKRSLRFLVDQLAEGDTVALTTYAGSTRLVLEPTGMHERARIHEAIEDLSSGGSTAMASGLQLAYEQAHKNLRRGSVNRVIVCSDGDANVGQTAHGDMLTSIAKFAADGITLSTLGFGMGNYKDNRMEQLTDKGNGNYSYIDTYSQAKRVFGEQLMGTLQVIAKDVKIQVEFNPEAVKRYRLVGYENRHIADKDFRNDKVDAGEIGTGHTVTAIYEIETTGASQRWATARVRWKKPDQDQARELAFELNGKSAPAKFDSASPNLKRALVAAALAENLRGSTHRKTWTLKKTALLAHSALSSDDRDEAELLELIDRVVKLGIPADHGTSIAKF